KAYPNLTQRSVNTRLRQRQRDLWRGGPASLAHPALNSESVCGVRDEGAGHRGLIDQSTLRLVGKGFGVEALRERCVKEGREGVRLDAQRVEEVWDIQRAGRLCHGQAQEPSVRRGDGIIPHEGEAEGC